MRQQLNSAEKYLQELRERKNSESRHVSQLESELQALRDDLLELKEQNRLLRVKAVDSGRTQQRRDHVEKLLHSAQNEEDPDLQRKTLEEANKILIEMRPAKADEERAPTNSTIETSSAVPEKSPEPKDKVEEEAARVARELLEQAEEA